MNNALPRAFVLAALPLFLMVFVPTSASAVELAMSEGNKRIVNYGVNEIEPSSQYQAGEVSTLRSALESIVPPGWSIFFERGEIAANQRISWETRGNWLDVLDDVAQSYDLQFIINHKDSSVIASAGSKFNLNVPKKQSLVVVRDLGPTSAPAKVPQNDTSANVSAADTSGGQQRLPSQVAQHTPAQSFIFDIRQGERLYEAMRRWTSEAGYQLVWQPQPKDGDIRFAANTAFGAHFEEAAQKFFAQLRTQPKFDAQLHTNRVLRVYVANARR